MTRSILLKSVFAFTLAIGEGGATHAQQPPPAPAPGTLPVSYSYRAKEILGSKINIQDNIPVGTVEDIVFTDAGEVEYLIVEKAGQFVTIPWSAAVFNLTKRTATVNITVDRYRAIPAYTATTYPQFFAPTYRAEVYKYFGLTPGQLRRMERRGEIP
jgi:sporulation protein YlmC with PRC-barrel domain